ncbi:hypothetical protein BD289DRAFT_20038 [Coniella lustricola]|uniref:Uncharacterized protein n=1 Tax=Coniella lustricola TaxID=2025994 RepID=A0A2T3AJH0_9PEZI|nr:hypothetical protein BD289DRAFT_20038 [Coniella lustricola]
MRLRHSVPRGHALSTFLYSSCRSDLGPAIAPGDELPCQPAKHPWEAKVRAIPKPALTLWSTAALKGASVVRFRKAHPASSPADQTTTAADLEPCFRVLASWVFHHLAPLGSGSTRPPVLGPSSAAFACPSAGSYFSLLSASPDSRFLAVLLLSSSSACSRTTGVSFTRSGGSANIVSYTISTAPECRAPAASSKHQRASSAPSRTLGSLSLLPGSLPTPTQARAPNPSSPAPWLPCLLLLCPTTQANP